MPRSFLHRVIPPLSCSLLGLLATTSRADYALHMYIGDFNHSGAAKTVVSNATAAFNNPALLPNIESPTFSVDAQYYISSVKFTNQGSSDAISQPLTGDNGGDPGSNTLVPGFYFAYPLSANLAAGITVNTPFGLSTEWDSSSWVGRYQSIKAGIETININPAIGYKLSDAWSIGAGISVQEAKAELFSAIDFGAVCFQLLDPTTCAGFGIPAPQSADGTLRIKGDDWGLGYHLGIHYTAGSAFFGITYHSAIDYALHGDADFDNPAQAAIFAPAFTDTTARVDITLPEVLSLGFGYTVSGNVKLYADATWTRWSRIKEYRIQFDNPAQPEQVMPRNWEDTWRLAIGADYKLNQRWLLQGGIAYAQSAIPDSTYDPNIPTTDAYWLNIGALYKMTEDSNLNIGLAHIFFEDRTINYTGSYGETVRGDVDSSLDVFGVRLDIKI